MRAHEVPRSSERGVTLVEVLVALVVLAIGILALGGLFPAGTRAQLHDGMRNRAELYAMQELEDLKGLSWTDPAIAVGRHPPGIATDNLGTFNEYHRFYQVDQLAIPLDNLKHITVTVSWTDASGPHSAATQTYVRR